MFCVCFFLKKKKELSNALKWPGVVDTCQSHEITLGIGCSKLIDTRLYIVWLDWKSGNSSQRYYYIYTHIYNLNNYWTDLEDCVLFWINCDNCIIVSGLIIWACIPRLDISVHSSRSPFIHFLCVYLVKLSGFGVWTWFL